MKRQFVRANIGRKSYVLISTAATFSNGQVRRTPLLARGENALGLYSLWSHAGTLAVDLNARSCFMCVTFKIRIVTIHQSLFKSKTSGNGEWSGIASLLCPNWMEFNWTTLFGDKLSSLKASRIVS